MKRILILGASRYYIRTIITARELGYEVHVADKNASVPGKEFAHHFAHLNFSDKELLSDYVLSEGINAIVPLNDYGVFPAAYVCEKAGLPGVGTKAASIAVNKATLRNHWQSHHVPNPKYAVVNSILEAEQAATTIGFPVIIKPAVSMGGARGVTYTKTIEQVAKNYLLAKASFNNNDGTQ